MRAIELLAAVMEEIPGLDLLRWSVTRYAAVTDLAELGDVRTEYRPGEHGGTLVVTPSPDALPVVNRLHQAGWRRGGDWSEQIWGWQLHAILRRGDALLKVTGCTRVPPEYGDGHRVPYFAPLPPELPARGPVSRRWKDEYAEWQRKCWEDEW